METENKELLKKLEEMEAVNNELQKKLEILQDNHSSLQAEFKSLKEKYNKEIESQTVEISTLSHELSIAISEKEDLKNEKKAYLALVQAKDKNFANKI